VPKRPLVSVIMPAYNTARYIATAIRSAQEQTLRNIEILIVDDGSTDETFAEALRCGAGDPRVCVVTQDNAGPSMARNRAMRIAQGEFFACLDSDDEWMPRYLEAQLAVFERRRSTGVVTSNAINRGGALDGTPYHPLQDHERSLSLLDMLVHEDAVCIMSVFRREVYDRIGPFDVRLSGNEDYEFWLRAAISGFEFVQTFEPLAYYTRRPDSASANERKMSAGILRVFGMVRDQVHTAEQREAVDKQIARFTRDLITIDAGVSLRNRDFSRAASLYAELYEREGGGRAAAIKVAARRAPRLLLWMADLRRAIRRAASLAAGA
jgi:glycosyltransferase involved in cell wall biosynthesis